MELLILVIISIVLGYLAASTARGQKIGFNLSDIPNRIQLFIKNPLGLRKRTIQSTVPGLPEFTSWAVGSGAMYFPEDLRQWWASLSDQEAQKFNQKLDALAGSMNLKIQDVISGEMNNHPLTFQHFIETTTAYSNEYRHTMAQDKNVDTGSSSGKEKGEAANIQMAIAEKQPSRRKSQSTVSTSK
jgi:hypothetical protein